MRLIKLTGGKTAKVDDDDYGLLSKISWQCNSSGYAKSSMDMYMHRLILGHNKKSYIDHINGDKLDNQRHNLRVVSQSVNLCNTEKANGKSKYRGVFYYGGKKGSWYAQFRHKHLGSFDNELEASKAYTEAKYKYMKENNAG